MKTAAICSLWACLLLLCACRASPPEPPSPSAASPPAVSGPESPPPEESAPSYVEGLALEAVLALDAAEGEAGVRAAYRYLVGSVYFADPVGLELWRYLSDEEGPIPYLENRALSPLRFGIGSCEDFAAAMVMLLRAQGLEAQYVAGYTLSVEQVYVDHAWAVVRLEGSWYHLDPQLEQNITKNSSLTYRYYLRSDEEMLTDHRWGENLISHWSAMPEEEKEAIRREYTPPACPASWPRPEPEPLQLPPKPDMAQVDEELNAIIAQSGKGQLPPLPLLVEPPVLVAERHVTPPLLQRAKAPSSTGYRRSLLTGEAGALYDALAQAAARFPQLEDVPLPPGLEGDAPEVVEAFSADHPACYWLEIDCPAAGEPRRLSLGASQSPEEITGQRAEIEAAAAPVLAGLEGRTPFEQALHLHDFLAGEVRYDKETTRRHGGNLYGALVEGVASCNGYAGAFQYLADRAGLETAYLTGVSTRGVAHAWNAVRLEGEWHYLDVTWDRPLLEGDGVYHDYFLMGEEEMRRDRRPGNESALPPPRSEGAPGYYERMGYAVSREDGEPVAAMADAFLTQLRGMESLPQVETPIFLELKVVGEPETYRLWKERYIKQVFPILRAMEQTAREENLPFSIQADASVTCKFNDTMQVLTFYPKVRQMEGSK